MDEQNNELVLKKIINLILLARSMSLSKVNATFVQALGHGCGHGYGQD